MSYELEHSASLSRAASAATALRFLPVEDGGIGRDVGRDQERASSTQLCFC